ncbi:MAG: BatD family protein, partial [Spirochaetaceae bacterium]|nr:BatD family protein [Spirochaetaceae bacterium]
MKDKNILLFLICIMILLSVSTFGETVRISAIVEKNNLSVGESFIYQVQIKGSENISNYPKDSWGKDNFSKDFSVKFLGGQNNSSRQVTIINGKRSETVNSGYFISYSLTPQNVGILTIPPISITIDGKIYTTKSIQIKVTEAEQSEDFHLKVSIDKNKCYVGEPLLLTFTWYIGVNVKDFTYSIPFFQNKNFKFSDPSNPNMDPSTFVNFPIEGATVNAVQGKGKLDGEMYTTLTFSKLVTPIKAGNFTIPKAVISVSAQTANNSGNNDFFNSFFSSVSPEYSQFSVPSNPLSLKVLDLPALNKPANFNGYIGELHIETTASPLDVKTGDPITLTMKIWGPKNISTWDAPDLQKQSKLLVNFKIPSEISAGKIDGESIIFTQTIRALNNKVNEIPALKIAYFDTKTGKYSFAESDPIPITVEYGKSLTIEGLSDPNSPTLKTNQEQQKLIQNSNRGINFNYEGRNILEKQSYGINSLFHFPLFGFIILPALIFFFILIIIIFQKYKLLSKKYLRKNTLGILKKDLKKIRTDNLFTSKTGKEIKLIFQNFLSMKMYKSIRLVTIENISTWLKKKGFTDKDFPLLFEVFEKLDELQFAGSFLSEENLKLKYEDI